MRAVVVGAVLAVALAGCGGNPTDEAQVRDVAAQYGQALIDQDEGARCALMANECDGEFLLSFWGAETPGEDIELPVTSVAVSGNEAMAELADGMFKLDLVKVGEDWKVARNVTLGEPAYAEDASAADDSKITQQFVREKGGLKRIKRMAREAQREAVKGMRTAP